MFRVGCFFLFVFFYPRHVMSCVPRSFSHPSADEDLLRSRHCRTDLRLRNGVVFSVSVLYRSARSGNLQSKVQVEMCGFYLLLLHNLHSFFRNSVSFQSESGLPNPSRLPPALQQPAFFEISSHADRTIKCGISPRRIFFFFFFFLY